VSAAGTGRRNAASWAVIAAYAAVVGIWGTTWLAIKIALLGLPTVTGVGVRFIIAGLFLYALAFALRIDLRKHAPPLHLVAVLAATLFGLNYACTYFAETHLASGLVAVLFGTLPFFVFGIARVTIGERASRATILGAIVAFAGVAVISLAGDLRGGFVYVAAALAAAFSSAYANVYLKEHAANEPLATLPPAMLLAGVVMFVGGSLTEHPTLAQAFAWRPLLALLYLAIFGSSIAFYLNHWLLQRISSGLMGLSALMIPVIAIAAGALFGGEIFGLREIAGGLLVILGVWLSMRGASPSRPAAAGSVYGKTVSSLRSSGRARPAARHPGD
jgi:drug/metabolite transporter (DMT)-like permease